MEYTTSERLEHAVSPAFEAGAAGKAGRQGNLSSWQLGLAGNPGDSAASAGWCSFLEPGRYGYAWLACMSGIPNYCFSCTRRYRPRGPRECPREKLRPDDPIETLAGRSTLGHPAAEKVWVKWRTWAKPKYKLVLELLQVLERTFEARFPK